MKTTKYIPLWIVSVGGVKYYPAADGETPKTIEGLTDKQIARLLKMKAIKEITFDDGRAKPADKMNYNELKDYAASIDLAFPGNISKSDLLAIIKKAETPDDDKKDNSADGDEDTVQE